MCRSETMTGSLSRKVRSSISYHHVMEPNSLSFLYWYKECPYIFRSVLNHWVKSLLSPFLSRSSSLCANLRQLRKQCVQILKMDRKSRILQVQGLWLQACILSILLCPFYRLRNSPEKLRVKSPVSAYSFARSRDGNEVTCPILFCSLSFYSQLIHFQPGSHHLQVSF